MATLREICDRTNLAVGTVSEVLRGLPGYSEQTRQRVLSVAEELNYSPNHLARGLRSRRSGSVGLVFESLASPSVTMAKLAIIERRARAAGYSCLIANHYDDADREAEAIKQLLGCQVEGLILWSSAGGNEGMIENLARQTALVTIDSPFATPTCDVSVDREVGGMLQVDHLIGDVGCRRVVFVIQPGGTGAGKIRGYERGLAKRGQTLADHVVIELPLHVDHAWKTGREVAEDLLASGESFDGIVVGNDSLAMSVLFVLTEAGRQVPEDVAVIGFNDEPFAAHLPVPLSTIRQPPEVGTAAFELLREVMALPDSDRGKLVRRSFDPELVVRSSSIRPAMG